MSHRLEPNQAQVEQLMALPADAPIGALNLFQFNERAQYQPGDPEYGTEAANVSGQEAYQRYGAIAGQFIIQGGGNVAFSTPVDQVMIGPADPQWDIAAVMYFPRRETLMAMLSNPEFQAASRHRKAAMANHYMLHLAGEPFKAMAQAG